MKENSWNDCLDFEDAIKITPDKEKAKSLIPIRIIQSATFLNPILKNISMY